MDSGCRMSGKEEYRMNNQRKEGTKELNGTVKRNVHASTVIDLNIG